MKFIVVMPTISQEMTKACVSTIDPEFRKNLLIIDNSKENLGVARSWNIGVKNVITREYDYLVIMSATIRFKDGMRGLVKLMEENKHPYGLETQHGWHLIVLSRKTLETVGLFDENFYPAYYEDSDYIRRMEILGIHNPMVDDNKGGRLPKYDVKAISKGNAHAVKSGINVNFIACETYFIQKWNGKAEYDSQEKRDKLFKHPFGDSTKSIGWFPIRTIGQLKKEYGLNTDE